MDEITSYITKYDAVIIEIKMHNSDNFFRIALTDIMRLGRDEAELFVRNKILSEFRYDRRGVEEVTVTP